MARARKAKAPRTPGEPLSRAERFDALIASIAAASIDNARSVAREAAKGWWDALTAGLSSTISPPACSLELPPVAPDVAAQARALGADLATLRVSDTVAEIGRLYTHSLPEKHRSENGIFYTPPALVRRLLDQAEAAGVDWQRAKVISPSCGCGAFLVEDALRMAEAMGNAEPAIVVASIGARLRGWDRDPFACWLSQLAVEAALLPKIVASGKRLDAITECRDSLMDDWSADAGQYDLVNDNPAFGKIKKSPALEERFSRSQRGHINLYGLFTDLAVHLARPVGGVIAYLTPTSYLAGDYFAKLRGLLSSQARPSSIDLVESREDVFPDVLQEVALSVFIRGRIANKAKCACVHVEPAGLRIDDVGELDLPKKAGAPWFIARTPESLPVIAAMQGMTARLSDWGYRVKTGPLVPHKNKASMRAKNSKHCVPVVWAESIAATGGRFSLRCERAGRQAWYLSKDGKDMNVTDCAALLLQRTTAKEQARRLIGAVMSAEDIASAGGRVAVENHVNMVIPMTGHPVVSMDKLAQFFASTAADRAFRCISGSVAVSATELEALPLPAADDLLAALSSNDSETALCCLYGITNGPRPETADPEAGEQIQSRHRPGRARRTHAAPASGGADPGTAGAHLS